MIRAVIFDCFGVLSEGSLSYLADLASPENREAVYDATRSADYGFISHTEYLQTVAELIGRATGDVSRIIKEKHVRNEPLVEYVRLLKKDYKTALLSNVGHSVIDKLFTPSELAELFDVMVLSSDVGMAKPSREIYELTASRLGMPPEECLMIDDIDRNINGAELAGMRGVLYASFNQAVADIRRCIETERRYA